MKKIYTIVDKISPTLIRVKDPVGREKTLVTDKSVIIGDNILVVNDIVIGRAKAKELRVYEV